jgi:hypothetical protein
MYLCVGVGGAYWQHWACRNAAVSTQGIASPVASEMTVVGVKSVWMLFETSSVLDLVGQKNAFQPECTMNCANITNIKIYLTAST